LQGRFGTSFASSEARQLVWKNHEVVKQIVDLVRYFVLVEAHEVETAEIEGERHRPHCCLSLVWPVVKVHGVVEAEEPVGERHRPHCCLSLVWLVVQVQGVVEAEGPAGERHRHRNHTEDPTHCCLSLALKLVQVHGVAGAYGGATLCPRLDHSNLFSLVSFATYSVEERADSSSSPSTCQV
jgi:hypothetical protein